MGKSARLTLAIVVATLLGCVVWLFWPGPADPLYQGKRLSAWLKDYVSRDTVIDVVPNPETDKVIRQIGTKAIPLLLRMLRAQDSPVKTAIREFADRQKIGSTRLPLAFWKPYYSTGQAAQAFGALGSVASNAVPQLLQIYRDNVGPESQMGCIRALSLIGPAANPAIPDLLRAVSNANPRVRSTAIEALASLHLDSASLIPLLTRSLQDSDSEVRYRSVTCLATCGPEARLAVPELTKLLQDPNKYVKRNAKAALIAIDPEAAAKAGVK